ncbi:hypothetical protein QFC19_004488 [Naganishia cerealis]|uniref:Uncharacterized protein n=1 Tax=Naganishia cerealis TaxID=610337 RepID=A0ACC2VVB0_9TREE|nr:hypothetical protein QFC19_004488 [Naganishia cerealis]
MSEGNANIQDSFEGDRSRHREDPPSSASRLSIEERSLIEELARGNQRRIAEAVVSENRRAEASASDPLVDGSSSWRIVYNDTEGQPILPPIDDLMSRLPEEHSRSTGYRRPDNASFRNNRETHATSILPPLPDNSDEAMDIEMTNQRMDETNGDRPARLRITDMSRARDLESLLGVDDDVFDLSRARFPSRLRHSATATSENPPAINARNVRDVDPSERRWLDMLYTRLPTASDNLSPHIRAFLSRRAAAGETADVPGGTALWNLMLQEDGSDEGEDDESEWERTSSPGEMSHRGTARNAAELLAELASAAGVSSRGAAQSQPEPVPVPSRPATNAHLRGTHVPQVIGTSNHVTSHTRTTGRDREPEGRGESGFLAESSSSGASLRRRKSIKRRRIESGMDISYPYPIMTSANSEPIPRSNLPEYMQMINTPILAIPTTFNPLDKCVRLNISPSTSSDAAYGPLVTVKFIGTGARGDADAAAVRTDHPIPPTCGIYYYEATIVSKGQDGYISIGLSNRFTNLSRLVGWEPGSYAWHMDDGFVFEGRGEGTSKGWPTSTTGDVIGCGVDFTTGNAFFTKNGHMIGHAFKNIGPDDKLYPSIGLRTPG